MKAFLGKLRDFITILPSDLRKCLRPRDKVVFLIGAGGRLVAHAINALAFPFLKRAWINPHAFLFRDIIMKTEDGVFHCRRELSDFTMCSELHEAKHRPFVDLKSGVFVDVGANIGKWTISVARRLGPRGKVVAIETEPSNFAALCRNIKANGLENVIPIQAACSNADGPVTLYRHPRSLHTSTIDRSHALPTPDSPSQAGLETTTVEGRTLDSLLDQLGIREINLLKIDVEGAEMAVLEGATHTLANSSPLRIIVEAWNPKTVPFLEAQGFKMTRIDAGDYAADRARL